MLRFPDGDAVRILLDGEHSGGKLTVVECIHAPGASDSHVHDDADKAVLVTAGRYQFRVAGEVSDVVEGSFVFVPRNTPHDFSVGAEGGRAIFMFSPSGIEHYFRELQVAGIRDAAQVAELRHRHHIEAVTTEDVGPQLDYPAFLDGGD